MDTYEKKYKESLALMVDCIPDEDGYVHVRPQDIFPELKGSGDEKIRKTLIDFFQDWRKNRSHCWGISVPEILTWLEKQGEHKKFRDSIQVGDEVTRNSDGVIVNLSQLNRVAKQGEQKLPIEKFHEGEWVVFNDKHESVYQIEKIENFQYTLRHILGGSMPLSFSHEDMIRVWTVKDAKNGDILQSSNKPFIYNEYLEEGKYPFGYGGINLYGRFGVSNGLLPMTHDEVTPATKEQRDLLFQKMNEAGYEWDAEKKELKKIEQKPQRIISAEVKEAMYDKPAWSEEDEVKINRIVACLENLNVADNDILLKDVDWLKSLKERYIWKPSDEQMRALEYIIDNAHNTSYSCKIAKELLEQLKKLKGE